MAHLRLYLAKIVGQSLGIILRRLPFSGGGAAPGLVALKIDPNFLRKQAKFFQLQIIVSGTNGKTTTTRMVSSLLKAHHLPFLHNRTGSNLLRGIASTILNHQSTLKTPPPPIGLWEVDEAVLPYAIEELKPQIVVLTNLFRDQLDRYGEIDTLARKWQQALQTLPAKATVILNGDDASLINLGQRLKNRVVYYGIEDPQIGETSPAHAADATFCPLCLKPLKYRQVFYSHLGNFSCSCGFKQPPKQLKAFSVQTGIHDLSFKLKVDALLLNIKLPLIGLFNVYNCLAALAVAKTLNLNLKTAPAALAAFRPAFGRMEKIKLKNKLMEMFLVKNPTGFNQIIATLKAKTALPLLVVAINDNFADGTDVSWLWDVDFEGLKGDVKRVILTGTRADDIALRLKYAGWAPPRLWVIPKVATALNQALAAKSQPIYVLPTYTAMLTIRDILYHWGVIHASWED